MRKVSFTLNHEEKVLEVNPASRLSDVLRNKLGCISTKVGCNAGDCGSCTVLVNSQAVCSCLISIAQVEGSAVETLEGISKDENLTRLQKSFLRFGASQCGICTPGMLMAAKAILEVNPFPNKKEVEDALGGVLCRCTGYRKIVEAVMYANQPDKKKTTNASSSRIGASLPYIDGLPKVNGKLKYGSDKYPEDTLHIFVVRSPYHCAEFEIGDKEIFVSQNVGIVDVIDKSDIPGRNCFGVIPPFADQPVFADGVVRYRGEAIAAVVGSLEALEKMDLCSFPVKWRELHYSLTPEESLECSKPDIHPDRQGNVLVRGYVEKGNVVKGLEEAVHSVRISCSTPFIEHGYIEPEAGFCIKKNGRLEIFGCTQAAQMDRESLAEIMDLSISDIRVIPSACGGGFGSKLDLSFQPFVAIAAWKLGVPVRISYNRIESMQSTTKRHPSKIELEVGCDQHGYLTGFKFNGVFNTGAYASWGPTVANRVPVHASGPYYVKNYCAKSVAVHTNTVPSGAFRGFGVPQSAIAQEIAFDQLADKVGIDRLEFRLRNALRNGQPTTTGQIFEQGVGITACLEALHLTWLQARREAREFNRSVASSVIKRGVGIGTCWYGCGNTSLPNPSTIRMGIKNTGAIVLHQGAMDIGQGANTVITQISAEALGVPIEAFSILDCDTDITPDCGKTSASRQTFITGMAAKLAGAKLREKILRLANVSEKAKIIPAERKLLLNDKGDCRTIDLAAMDENEFGYVVMAEETFDPPTSTLDGKGQGNPYAVYGYGAQVVQLSVDLNLGIISLDKITSAHDVGRAINPLLVEGQIEGGVAQGIGLAIMEEFVPGKTENLHDYLIPTFGDMPDFENFILEIEEPLGPYGAKGLGEHVLIPTAPAILNAVRDATGAVITELPATPDKVLKAILQLNGAG